MGNPLNPHPFFGFHYIKKHDHYTVYKDGFFCTNATAKLPREQSRGTI